MKYFLAIEFDRSVFTDI